MRGSCWDKTTQTQAWTVGQEGSSWTPMKTCLSVVRQPFRDTRCFWSEAASFDAFVQEIVGSKSQIETKFLRRFLDVYSWASISRFNVGGGLLPFFFNYFSLAFYYTFYYDLSEFDAAGQLTVALFAMSLASEKYYFPPKRYGEYVKFINLWS